MLRPVLKNITPYFLICYDLLKKNVASCFLVCYALKKYSLKVKEILLAQNLFSNYLVRNNHPIPNHYPAPKEVVAMAGG